MIIECFSLWYDSLETDTSIIKKIPWAHGDSGTKMGIEMDAE